MSRHSLAHPLACVDRTPCSSLNPSSSYSLPKSSKSSIRRLKRTTNIKQQTESLVSSYPSRRFTVLAPGSPLFRKSENGNPSCFSQGLVSLCLKQEMAPGRFKKLFTEHLNFHRPQEDCSGLTNPVTALLLLSNPFSSAVRKPGCTSDLTVLLRLQDLIGPIFVRRVTCSSNSL